MNRYFIEDEKGQFWCERDFGYWSRFESSLEFRFEGVLIWVLPLYLMMRMSRVKCKLRRISNGN